MYVGKTIDPDSAYYSLVNWSGSDDSVFTVDSNGQITGVAKGNATLTAQINNASADATVSVYELSTSVSGSDDQTTVTDAAADTVEQITKGEDTPKAEIDNADQAKKELEEAAKRGDEFSVDMSKDDKSKEDLGADWDKAQSAAGGKEFGGAYDVTLDFKHKDQSGAEHHIGNITELDKDITFELDMPDCLPEVELGYVRDYSIVRIHDGAAETVPFEITESGNFKVTSDKFSDYVVTYSDAVATVSDGWTQWDTLEWKVDDKGCLILRPLGGAACGSSSKGFNFTSLGSGATGFKIEGKISLGGLTFMGASDLREVDLTGLDTSSAAITAGHMFDGCSSLESIEFGDGFDTSNVTYMLFTFRGCSSLTSLDLSGWDTSNVVDMYHMFDGCTSLESLDLSSFDTSKVVNTAKSARMGGMFDGCASLRSVSLGAKFSFCGSGSERQCSLPTPSGDGLTGRWVSSSSSAIYAGDAIPNNIAATYTAQVSSESPDPTPDPTPTPDPEPDPTPTPAPDPDPTPTPDSTPEPVVTKIAAPTAATGLVYNGSKQTGVSSGKGYTLSGTASAADAGTYKATATLAAGYAWSDGSTAARTVEWSIAKADISSGKAEVSGSAVYMGRAVEPAVTVTVGGKALAAGTDYAVAYSGNEGLGAGRATVTGKGNYSGTLAADFAITSDVVNVFSDASHEDWYVESGALDYAYAHGLISGYSGTDLVGAYDPIKRQDVAVILWRMAGESDVASGDGFEDVDYNDYYGPAVRWARATGVINGYQDADGAYRTFGPSDLVTREQLAAMIANYAERIGGMTVASDCAKLDALPDAGSVSDWARASVGWCMDHDIMNGVNVEGTAYAQPSGNAWRASMASMAAVLHRDVLKLG